MIHEGRVRSFGALAREPAFHNALAARSAVTESAVGKASVNSHLRARQLQQRGSLVVGSISSFVT